MKTIFRKDAFGANPPNVLLADLLTPPKIRPFANDYESLDQSKLQELILSKFNWRYHHNLDFLLNSNNPNHIYDAYVRRVDTMLEMAEDAMNSALEKMSKKVSDVSAIDLGCAEGFVTMYLSQLGIKSIDSLDLNQEQLSRFSMVEAYKGIERANKYIVDFEHPGWSLELNHKYDLVFCLGVIYHMENPMLFMRNVFEITNHACIIESDTPIIEARDQQSAGYFKQIQQQVTKKSGDIRYILELRPNLAALINMVLAVGFESVSIVEPPKNAVCPYLKKGTKSILLAFK